MESNGVIFEKLVAVGERHRGSKRKRKYFSTSYEATISEIFQQVFVVVRCLDSNSGKICLEMIFTAK